ncbi:MAG: FapA family protein [Syntrophomonadaceae bacterium]|nr:FapA family protein [Syntrophomonadaceae bacterium]MDD3897337.1 FapA family protein [Syntrophomonadaceae bacterium]
MTDNQYSIDGKANIIIDKDLLKAYLEIVPPSGGGNPCTMEMVKSALAEKNISFGINEDSIKEALEEENWGFKILVAEGKPPVNGKDAKIIYKFPLPSERTGPKIDEKGNVNYYDLGLIHNVKMGQLLVEKIPGDDGNPGTSVLGTEIPARKGKDIRLPRGNNTVADEDELNLFATIDGHVSIADSKVIVNPVLTIARDVDFSTGDIDFVGNVCINGNVNSGFKVNSGGDIEIRGFIDGAEVTAAGSILVKGGITGCMKTLIKARDSIHAHFVENSRLDAGRDVAVREAIMQSYIKAGGNITVSGRKALIVGGIIQAGREVEARVMGSQLATQTIIEVGVSPYLREEYQVLNRVKGEKKKTMDIINHNLQVFQRSGISPENLSEKKKMELIKMLDNLKNLRQELEQITERIAVIENEFQKTQAAKVRVLEIVYPGVRISIGQSIYIVNDPIKYSEFILDQGEVRLTSLR